MKINGNKVFGYNKNSSTTSTFFCVFLPPANEVWGKVMFPCLSVHGGGHLPTGVVCIGGFAWGDLHRGGLPRGVLHEGEEGSASRGIGQNPHETRKAVGILLECFLVTPCMRDPVVSTRQPSTCSLL